MQWFDREPEIHGLQLMEDSYEQRRANRDEQGECELRGHEQLPADQTCACSPQGRASG